MRSLAGIFSIILIVFAQSSFAEFQKIRIAVWGGAKGDPRELTPDKSIYAIPLTDSTFECQASVVTNSFLKGMEQLDINCTSKKLGLDITGQGTCMEGDDKLSTALNKAGMAKIRFVEKEKTERVIWMGCSSAPIIKR